MSRLPIVFGDNNTWGSVLNDFLAHEHHADGTHGPITVSVGHENGITVRATAATGLSDQLVLFYDHLGNPIASIGIAGGFVVYGDDIRVGPGVFPPRTVTLKNTRGVVFGDNENGTWEGAIHSGTGTPATFFGVQPHQAGEYFFRTDTPGSANQRIYVCTVAGSPGTWVGIV